MLIYHRILPAEMTAPGASSFLHAYGGTGPGAYDEWTYATSGALPSPYVRLPVTRAGNLHNFAARIVQNLFVADTFVTLLVNGVAVTSITVGAGVVGAFSVAGTWPVVLGDVVSIGYDATTGGGAGGYFTANVELY